MRETDVFTRYKTETINCVSLGTAVIWELLLIEYVQATSKLHPLTFGPRSTSGYVCFWFVTFTISMAHEYLYGIHFMYSVVYIRIPTN